jgi:hypothetical protein
MTPFECPGVSEAMHEDLGLGVTHCRNVGYCDDGTRISPGRCTGSSECADFSDERSCFDYVGYDMVQCGDQTANPWAFCSLPSCGDVTEAPRCDEATRQLLCPDGSELTYDALCNRKDDCADGADERHCLR